MIYHKSIILTRQSNNDEKGLQLKHLKNSMFAHVSCKAKVTIHTLSYPLFNDNQQKECKGRRELVINE